MQQSKRTCENRLGDITVIRARNLARSYQALHCASRGASNRIRIPPCGFLSQYRRITFKCRQDFVFQISPSESYSACSRLRSLASTSRTCCPNRFTLTAAPCKILRTRTTTSYAQPQGHYSPKIAQVELTTRPVHARKPRRPRHTALEGAGREGATTGWRMTIDTAC